jgi:hypothetical protein
VGSNHEAIVAVFIFEKKNLLFLRMVVWIVIVLVHNFISMFMMMICMGYRVHCREVKVFFIFIMKVAYYSSATQRLANAEVRVPQV